MVKVYKNKNEEVVEIQGERLLTNAEKEFLLEGYKNKSRYKVVFIIYLIGLIPFTILSIFFYKFNNALSGVICFLFLNLIFFMFIILTDLSIKKQIKQIKENKLYVMEAIYEYSTNGTGFFKLSNKSELYGEQAMLCEYDIKSGDRVILVKKKSQVWVYKARN